MRWVASAGYETLTPDDCLEVVDFIEQNGDDRAISLRLLEPCSARSSMPDRRGWTGDRSS